MAQIYWKLKQNTAAWFKARSGIPTASEFDKIITPKKGEMSSARWKYACRLLGERLLRWQGQSLEQIKHIEDGKENEPLAMAQLQMLTGMETHTVGFVTTNDGRFGASPDRAIGGNPQLTLEVGSLDVVIEAKCPTIPVQFEYALAADIAELSAAAAGKSAAVEDDPYRCQRQGQLYIGEADKAIFYSFNPRMPEVFTETGRDEPFIKKLAAALDQFSDELEELHQRALRLGTFQPYAEMLTPVDAELGANLRSGPMPTDAELEELINGDRGNKLQWGA